MDQNTPTPPLLYEDESELESHRVPSSHQDRESSQLLGADDDQISHNDLDLVPKTPNRNRSSVQGTPRSRSRRTTPRSGGARTPGRGSVRREPSTPYTIRAIQQVNALTPIRNVVRETKRYSPRDDLRFLSRLLIRERDSQKSSTTVIEESFIETPARLQPPAEILPRPLDNQLAEGTSRLSENHTTTLSELDDEQRRVSGRMSGRFSFPTGSNVPSDLFTDLAVPEAVVDDELQVDNENFGYDDDIAMQMNLNLSSDDDDDQLENNLAYSDDDEFEFSLLQNRESLQQGFKPLKPSNKTRNVTSDLKLPLSFIRSTARQFLSTTTTRNRVFKQKQFSKDLLAEIQQISDEFLSQQMDDLTFFAKHAGRKTINADDFTLLLKRHREVSIENFSFDSLQHKSNKSTQLFCLAQKICSLSELKEIESNLFKDEQKTRRKKRRIQIKEEPL